MNSVIIYIILFAVVLIATIIITGLIYWYTNVRCAQDREVNELCFKDCDCKNSKKCGYNNGSQYAVPVCCPSNTVTIDGRVYCDSLPNNTVCVNSSMCASNNCLNNICTTSNNGGNPTPSPNPNPNPTPTPNPTPNPTPTPNPRPNPTPSGLPRGSDCTISSQCVAGLICASDGNGLFAKNICCRASTNPQISGCGDLPSGTPCTSNDQCESRNCTLIPGGQFLSVCT